MRVTTASRRWSCDIGEVEVVIFVGGSREMEVFAGTVQSGAFEYRTVCIVLYCIVLYGIVQYSVMLASLLRGGREIRYRMSNERKEQCERV